MQILISHLSAWSLTIYLKVMTKQLLLRFVKLLKPTTVADLGLLLLRCFDFSWIPGHWIRLVVFDQPFPIEKEKKRKSEDCCMHNGKWNKSLLIDCCRAHIPTFLRNLSTAYQPFEKQKELNGIKKDRS